ncbi:P-loop containing nucleoside triphosphate hydrolase protein [Chaetomium fimeti]|uniref:P-loop containing nucleoside triphosphate hydrolase protein n=1 Tax=Chaetomium fimeti TaxID=1854472 RepID=A0AAE0LR58_9PEZI|nr:P-loop containing nucleoside triphosphate hydrolase protein [Chaetomium fimeti]
MEKASAMSASTQKATNLFQVFLRLRPPPSGAIGVVGERFLAVEEPDDDSTPPKHITLNPPNDRRRAIEKFAFTQVFEEDATQLDLFHCIGVADLVKGVLAPCGGEGTDALLATLGVTGSGKSHTILGSRSQRGLTQLSLDVIFRSIGKSILDCDSNPTVEHSIAASDPSEAVIFSASTFLDAVYADPSAPLRASSRAQTPMNGESIGPGQTPSRRLHRPSTFPQQPDVSALSVSCDPSAEYAIVISMYEVYNDRIFDLLTPPIKSTATKEYRRRPLLFKPTEGSPDRKAVAGLRKVICGNLHQALMVLEAGLHERRVAGTGSNSVSSRSHGFFCVEVKKRTKDSRKRGGEMPWGGSALTVVDLAGSERARDAKTAGATLAEAGKINESLMYLGQCLQMQSDAANKDKPNLVPFRQCKLTELLFSNSYPSSSGYSSGRHRNPQKAVMIVTADPHGDFNATSQILRYSALAREVTVPRVPSITQTILTAAAAPAPQQHSTTPVESPTLTRPFSPFGGPGGSVHYPRLLSSPPNIVRKASPTTASTRSNSSHNSEMHRSTMEAAALEISRLAEEGEYLRQALDTERAARHEAESHLLSMEDRMIELEQAIREDCTNEFERRLEIEMARWRATMQVEMERGEEHWGRKIEVFERSMAVAGGGGGAGSDGEGLDSDEDKENVLVEDVHQENERLRKENEALRREVAGMSPTKRMPLQERGSDAGMAVRGKAVAGPETGSPRPGRVTRGGGAGDDEASLLLRLEKLRVNDGQGSARGSGGSGSPKKVRRLPAKRWNAVRDDDDLF